MKRDVVLYLKDILESISIAETHISNLSKKDFLENTKTQDAVILRLAVIGEAIKYIPRHFREEFPRIPWRDIIAMRNVLLHEYFSIDFEMTWKTIEKDLPKLRRVIEKILKTMQ